MPTNTRGRRYGGPIGFDGLYKVGGQRAVRDQAPQRARWLDDRTFQLEYQTTGNDDAAMATVVFDGTSLSGRVATLGTWINLKGEAD